MADDKKDNQAEAAFTRRDLLRGIPQIGAAALAPATIAGCGSSDSPLSFQHGVASGDPLPDGVILWTRVTPRTSAAVTVTWEVAADPSFQQIAATGTVAADAERDFTVKVDVRDLESATTYNYRFIAQGATSPVGRTRTAPRGAVERARFGVASCASFAQGYFHAYRGLSRRADLDAVIHLGDYIYESGPGQFGSTRTPEPAHEAISLADYRARYAQARRDPDLQEVHRQHPFIVVWDDHESADNAWKDGAGNHQSPAEGDWSDRKAAAQRAYAEWMPIREQEPRDKIWRKLSFGDLADLIMLDTRLWGRTASTGALVGPPPASDPTRTLLGDDQAAWLEDQIASSTARWKLVGQQVMVANLILAPGMLVNLDQWHGYPESRRRFLDFVRASGATNVVVLTGDIHSSWAAELVNDPADPAEYDPVTGQGAAAVEMVTPGITSPGLPPEFLDTVQSAKVYNPHQRWFDLVQKGYLVLDVTPARAQAAWFLYADITQANPASAVETFAAAWSVASGSTRLVEDAAAADPPADFPPLAP